MIECDSGLRASLSLLLLSEALLLCVFTTLCLYYSASLSLLLLSEADVQPCLLLLLSNAVMRHSIERAHRRRGAWGGRGCEQGSVYSRREERGARGGVARDRRSLSDSESDNATSPRCPAVWLTTYEYRLFSQRFKGGWHCQPVCPGLAREYVLFIGTLSVTLSPRPSLP